MAMKVSHEYICTVRLLDAHTHKPLCIVISNETTFMFRTTFKDCPHLGCNNCARWIHSFQTPVRAVQPCISDRYLFVIVWRLHGIDFPIQQQRDINVYYYYCSSFPFAICVFAHQFQFVFNEWSQGMRCGGVKRCICSLSHWGSEFYRYLEILRIQIKATVWLTWWVAGERVRKEGDWQKKSVLSTEFLWSKKADC